jgi:4-diphosphocytidyl-2-C-methyl-D-erythritol kinase
MQTWPAPAKLNLFLHVVGRRADGYHLLQTVFQFLDHGDELEFRVTGDGRVTRAADLPGVPAAADLTLRAARLLQARTNTVRGVEIHLRKRIPAGGGLGGGSSDAATTLLALNELWELDWERPRLAALGLELGADVPVFVLGQAAWAEGVGEVLTPVELAQPWYVVLSPPVSVSTAAVFAGLQLTRYSPAITIRDFRAGRTRNDLEPAVRRQYPQVDSALTWLSRFGEPRMTGSGGCVFVEVESADAGQAILAQAPARLRGFVARGVNRHPLL